MIILDWLFRFFEWQGRRSYYKLYGRRTDHAKFPLDLTTTPRGFDLAQFIDRYGQQCSIQKSSIATEDCIWLGVDFDMNDLECTRMHLTQDQVSTLLPLLTRFVETGEIA